MGNSVPGCFIGRLVNLRPQAAAGTATEQPQPAGELRRSRSFVDCGSSKDESRVPLTSCTGVNARNIENNRNRRTDNPWKLPFEQIKLITNNFSEELGRGAFGQVFKGVREDGEEVAVKILRFMGNINDNHFENEFEILKRLEHPNIVRLVAFCDDAEEELVEYKGKLIVCQRIHRALCLEYMPNGNLGVHLPGDHLDKNWQIRYRIIKGICKGLEYLQEGLEFPIFHLDLKPDNILLNKEMVPKISDFGLSRIIGEENTKKTLSPLGTIGYLPPEFINYQVISKEYDIYSLGVIVTKIITGTTGYSVVADMGAQEFVEHVYENWKKCLQEIPKYASLEVDCEQVKRCIDIAIRCMENDRHKRPTIKDIVSQLDKNDMKNLKFDALMELKVLVELPTGSQPLGARGDHAARASSSSQFLAPSVSWEPSIKWTSSHRLLQSIARQFSEDEDLTKRFRRTQRRAQQQQLLSAHIESALAARAARLERTRSGAHKALRFISSNKANNAWMEVQANFDRLDCDGFISLFDFAECIGMTESKEFALELFDTLSRRRQMQVDKISFRLQITDNSFDSRLQIFLDMVDKNADGRIGEEEVKEYICAGREKQISDGETSYTSGKGLVGSSHSWQISHSIHPAHKLKLIKVCIEYNGKLTVCQRIHRALCLEYIPNGSLGEHLPGENLGNDWPIHYKIIKGICEGLEYLQEGLEFPILHLDLTENILLNEEMMPKISDFGLSRLIGEENSKKTLTPLGTIGYLPPEFINYQVISREYDIYSLGGIITKTITGITGYSDVADMGAEEFVEHVHENSRKCLQEIPRYESLEVHCKQVKRYIEIARRCMENNRHKRPTIKDILSQLDEIGLENYKLDSPLQWGEGPTIVPVLSEDDLDSSVKAELVSVDDWDSAINADSLSKDDSDSLFKGLLSEDDLSSLFNDSAWDDKWRKHHTGLIRLVVSPSSNPSSAAAPAQRAPWRLRLMQPALGMIHPARPEQKQMTAPGAPFLCNGCKEPGYGPRSEHDFSGLHTRCARADDPLSGLHTLVQPLFGYGKQFQFRFLHEPPHPVQGRLCDACGEPTRGFVYHCSEQDVDLHPCCASLPDRIIQDGHAFDLHRRASRPCALCPDDEGQRRWFWAYRCYMDGDAVDLHVACLKQTARRSWEDFYRDQDALSMDIDHMLENMFGEIAGTVASFITALVFGNLIVNM